MMKRQNNRGKDSGYKPQSPFPMDSVILAALIGHPWVYAIGPSPEPASRPPVSARGASEKPQKRRNGETRPEAGKPS
jgi:hypothetical protein